MKPALAIAVAIFALTLTGCASLPSADELSSVDTYAKCAAADTVTTAVGLATNRMMEGNPLVKALTIPSLGHVAGTIVPLIGLSIAGYYLLKELNEPTVTVAVSAATCAVALHNVYIIGWQAP